MWKLDHKKGWMLKNWFFSAVVLKKTHESPLDYKIIPDNLKGNQSWIFIRSTKLKLKLKYFGHQMWTQNSLEKTLMLGKIEDMRSRGLQRTNGWMASLTQWTWVWASCTSWWWTGNPGKLQSMQLQRVRHVWVTELNFKKWESEVHSSRWTSQLTL